MIKETKRRMEFFSLYDHTNIEKHLEKMALKGWMIENIGSTFWKYEKVEPQKLRFSVVYYPKKVNEGVLISEDRQHFIDMCTSGGWEFVINKDQMHIFCTKDENTPPIETDPEIQIECIHKFAKHEIISDYLLAIICFLFLLAFFGYYLWKEPIETLSDMLYQVWDIPFVIGFSIYNIISYLIWYKKAKIAAENGEFTDTKRLIKFEILFWLPLYCFSTALNFLSLQRARDILFTFGLITVAIIFFYLFKKIRSAVYKSKCEDKSKRRIRNLIGVLLVVVYVAVGIFASIIIPKDYDKIEVKTDEGTKSFEIYHDEGAPLDISEFTDIEGKTTSRKKSVDEYLLIKQSEWSIFSLNKGDKPTGIFYTITDVRFTSIMERCKNELIFDHLYYDYQKVDMNTEYVVYSHITEKTKKRKAYVFCDDSRIVEMYFDWEPTNEELKYAADKLLNA